MGYDHITPIGPRPVPVPVQRVERRRRSEEEDEHPDGPPRRDTPPRRRPAPPDDGRPHVDVRA